MRVEVHVTEGPAQGQQFSFDKDDCFLFGRTADANVSLPHDHHVSRQHFLLVISSPSCTLIDLDSKNGVFVNGVRYGGRKPPESGVKQAPEGVNEVQLNHGDEIIVGDTRMTIWIHRDARDAIASSLEQSVFSTMRPATNKEVALLVFDIVQSTQYLLDVGDSRFNSLIDSIHRRFRTHQAASEMSFLKCTGDGFLSAFTTVRSALIVAASFLELPVQRNIHVRMALHWGSVKTGPAGDLLGRDVHKVCRIESLKLQDQVTAIAGTPFPQIDRILITQQGLDCLTPPYQAKFTPLGTFRLKGFEEACTLWGVALGMKSAGE